MKNEETIIFRTKGTIKRGLLKLAEKISKDAGYEISLSQLMNKLCEDCLDDNKEPHERRKKA